MLEPEGIKLADRERANAALGTSGTTGKPLSATLHGVGESRINDLDQGVVAGWKRVGTNGHD
jgi:hypothetical protein